MRIAIFATGLATMLAACAHTGGGAPPARAQLKDANGQAIGEATIRQQGAGLRVSVQVRGIPAGTHGVHVHTIGKCEAPAFTSAGGHWNPTGKQHGKDNPAGMHKGDLPNMTVGGDGRGSLEFAVDGTTLAELMDADGAAVVVHAAADDYKTDPAGNSGARIACGVLSAS